MERLIGDQAGIDALRSLSKTNREFLKYLITEARSNSDHTAAFQAEDGTKYKLKLDLATGQMEVSPAD